MSSDTKQNTQNPGNSLQPIIYGVLPDQLNDEINLGDLFSKLADQWKLIIGFTLGGTILSVLLALILPGVYQPSVTVSVPLTGNVSPVATVNTLLGGKSDELPATPQAVFTSYFNLLRSNMVLAKYVHEKKYLEKLYPDTAEPESVLLAGLLDGWHVSIVEPTPEKKGAYLANPKRVKIILDIEDEVIGVDLLNGFSSYANQRLIADLQNDVRQTVEKKIEILDRQVAQQRDQYRQARILTIKKMEHDNLKKIALLEEQISAALEKGKASRATQIANAKEALEMAKSLNIENPTTIEALAQRLQNSKAANTAVTVLSKQSLSLYLQGSKYLVTLIETLENRKSDEVYLPEINGFREKIHIIKNDQVLAALKNRESDDPWIEDLPEKLAQIKALKELDPDFTSLLAYSMDESAIITDKKVKPKRKLIVVIGFVLSLFIAIFVAMIVASRKDVKHESI